MPIDDASRLSREIDEGKVGPPGLEQPWPPEDSPGTS